MPTKPTNQFTKQWLVGTSSQFTFSSRASPNRANPAVPGSSSLLLSHVELNQTNPGSSTHPSVFPSTSPFVSYWNSFLVVPVCAVSVVLLVLSCVLRVLKLHRVTHCCTDVDWARGLAHLRLVLFVLLLLPLAFALAAHSTAVALANASFLQLYAEDVHYHIETHNWQPFAHTL